jgi:hypothetical protein
MRKEIQQFGTEREAVLFHFRDAYNSLVKVYNLAEGDIGGSAWFCDGYPFGSDLGEFLASFSEYILKIREAQ